MFWIAGICDQRSQICDITEREKEKKTCLDACISGTSSKCDCWTLVFPSLFPLHCPLCLVEADHITTQSPMNPWAPHSHMTHTTASDTELNGLWHVTRATEQSWLSMCTEVKGQNFVYWDPNIWEISDFFYWPENQLNYWVAIEFSVSAQHFNFGASLVHSLLSSTCKYLLSVLNMQQNKT